jgi:proline dehydrogenase
MDEMLARGLKAKVSVKLTQMGLKLDKELCFRNMERIVGKAEEQESFVRIDMEDSSCTSDTLEIYSRLRERYGGRVGPVVQASLRRSLNDVRRLAQHRANVRVCKGIYVEPREIAYQDPQIINESFAQWWRSSSGTEAMSASPPMTNGWCSRPWPSSSA